MYVCMCLYVCVLILLLLLKFFLKGYKKGLTGQLISTAELLDRASDLN